MKNENQLDDFFGLQQKEDKASDKSSIREALTRKLSFGTKLHLVPKVLTPRERYLILGLLVTMILSFLSLPLTTYYHYTEETPSTGGKFTEGILGEPRLVNPLIQVTDADHDITPLIFSGLLKYDNTGKLVPDLAKSYPEISADGLSYTIFIRENAYWHDGTKITADDVVFTVQTAQNKDYGTNLIFGWQGVEIQKINDQTVIFKLKDKYAMFTNNLTMGILPKHLWQGVKPINFALHPLNLEPKGSGPYVFSKPKKNKNTGRIESWVLKVNENYYGKKPFIEEIEFKFFAKESDMITAFNNNEIESIGGISPENLNQLKFRLKLKIHQIDQMRYFAGFINQNQSEILSDKNIRKALSFATNRSELIEKVIGGKGKIADSPIPSGIMEDDDTEATDAFDPQKASEALADSGWTEKENGVLIKRGKEPKKKTDPPAKTQKLTVKITTSTWPELAKTSQILKEQWEKVGFEVTVETLPIEQLQRLIKDRQYEILVFGEILAADPDPFPFWHSSGKKDPGLNLCLYDNKAVDALLEEARRTINPKDRAGKYMEFEKLIAQDIPAIFLFSPFYIYGQSSKIEGFDTQLISSPYNRFSNIEEWYVKTDRRFKK